MFEEAAKGEEPGSSTWIHYSRMEDQDQDHAKKKWWAGGKWRSEATAEAEKQELDSKTVHVVPGPPAELDGAELQHPNEAGRVVYPHRDHSTSGI
jgi:hypothetical protein